MLFFCSSSISLILRTSQRPKEGRVKFFFSPTWQTPWPLEPEAKRYSGHSPKQAGIPGTQQLTGIEREARNKALDSSMQHFISGAFATVHHLYRNNYSISFETWVLWSAVVSDFTIIWIFSPFPPLKQKERGHAQWYMPASLFLLTSNLWLKKGRFFILHTHQVFSWVLSFWQVWTPGPNMAGVCGIK